MAKTIILSYLLFLIPLYAYTGVPSDYSDCVNNYYTKANIAVEISDSFEGIKEIGDNEGFSNKSFERMMKDVGWYKSAPWCAFSLKLIYKLAGVQNTVTGFSPTAYNKSHVIYTDGKLYEPIRPGDSGTLSYAKYKNNKSRFKAIGHAFIIKRTVGNSAVVTGEGNTDGNGAREGNGYYEKIRPLNANIHITRWDK
jgi:hypothetical protein